MLDALFRFGYRGAYWCARAWWFVRRPRTRGAAIALWAEDRVLLVKTSYRKRCSLPGGFVGANEQTRDAACREVREETGIVVPPERLRLVYEQMLFVEHHYDTLSIFEMELTSAPAVAVNGRELIWIGWKTAEEAASLPLLSHVRAYLAARDQRP
jgi:ADP-ribose pyrophosphatase YjhB (NUDIX family)